jgi:hypothetical protein
VKNDLSDDMAAAGFAFRIDAAGMGCCNGESELPGSGLFGSVVIVRLLTSPTAS